MRGGGEYLIAMERSSENATEKQIERISLQRSMLNQSDFGRMVGVSRQTISQIERGDYSPSVTLALKIAKACGANVEDIFSYEEEERG